MSNHTSTSANIRAPNQKFQPTGEQVASWVIRRLDTRQAIFETYNHSVAMKVNAEKFEAVPILQHLQEINAEVNQ